MRGAYNTLLPAARLGVRIAAPFSPKLRAGLAGRRGLGARLASLGRAHAGQVVWFHSTSVGEYEQARPVAALLRQRHPELVPFHSFFSPSGYEYAKRLGEAEHFDWLPEDAWRDVTAALDALQPRALVVMKFDLWPNLIAAARRRGVPVVLLDATLKPGSWRSRWPVSRLYRDVYLQIDVISAVSAADANRFRALVPRHPGLYVDGDTRFDQVVRRRAGARHVGLHPGLLSEPRPFTLVAGSTWPADEAILVSAWTALLDGTPAEARPRLVLVPHEPTPEHLEPLERVFRERGIATRRYSEGDASFRGVWLVDRVGILAELYAAGDAAYVGGAFSTGVHNLLEPASMGLPLLFGPAHQNAPEAALLLDADAGSVVGSAAELVGHLRALLQHPDRRRQMGSKAQATVAANLGASERCYARLAPFFDLPRKPVLESAR